MRVLVVEPDATAAEHLAGELRRRNHVVDNVRTGADALRMHHRADLILVDLELPDVDGLEVCHAVRAAGHTPLIAVTSRASELDCVLALQAGADDYVVKPYSFVELMARVGAVMRRSSRATADTDDLECGPLQIRAASREIRLDGRWVNMTRKEFDLLYMLASRPDVVFSRHEIALRVWDGGCIASSRTIDTHVSSIRSKLGSGSWIETVRGVGFKFGRGDGGSEAAGHTRQYRCPRCGARHDVEHLRAAVR